MVLTPSRTVVVAFLAVVGLVQCAASSAVTEEPQAPVLPWAILPRENSSAFSGSLQNGDCVGVLISPTAALFTASCVQGSDGRSLAISLHASDDSVETTDITRVGNHWRVRDLGSIVTHPQFQIDQVKYDFAVVQWPDPVGKLTQPVLLDSFGNASEFAVIILSMDNSGEISKATISQSTYPCNSDEFNASGPDGGWLLCLEPDWDNLQACSETNRSQFDGFMKGSTSDRRILSGVVSRNVKCLRDATYGRHQAVMSRLENARTFIDDHVTGHQWADSLNGDAPGDSTGSGSNIVEGSSGPTPPESWRLDLDTRYGFLSAHDVISEDPHDITDGGLAAIIAPEYLITRASWIRNLPAIQYVHLQSESIKIQRLHFQEDANHPDANQLVVIQLERAIAGAESPQLPVTLPPKYKDLESLTLWGFKDSQFFTDAVSTYDGVLLSYVHMTALEDRQLCQLPDENTDDLICIQTSGFTAVEMRDFRTFNVSFLFIDGLLVGLSHGSSITAPNSRVAQAFQPVGGSPATRRFVDQATNSGVTWTTDDVYAQHDNVPVLYGRVWLHSEDDAVGEKDTAIQCGVVPIGGLFYLTMASCIADTKVKYATFEAPPLTKEEEREYYEYFGRRQLVGDEGSLTEEKPPIGRVPHGAIEVASVYIHPLYEQAQSAAYDFAIIQIADYFSTTPPVMLFGSALAHRNRVIEHDIAADVNAYSAALVTDAASCGNSQDANQFVCVGVPEPTTNSKCDANSRRTLALFYRVGKQVMFVGFSTSSCTSSRRYSRVSSLVNFINAIVEGAKWGSDEPSTATDEMKLPGYSALPNLTKRRPYVVGLRLTKDGQNFCGGSLIAPQFVLTAAHCVTDGLASWVSVGSTESAGLNTEPIPVLKSRVIIHPLYQDIPNLTFDAAVLELTVPAYETGLKLDATPDFADGSPAAMFGYGLAEAMGTTLSPIMHARQLSLLSKKRCSRILPDRDDSKLCAESSSGLDACQGDSGSPLIVADPASGEEFLVGIVSAGYGCGLVGVPGLYTRVSQLVDFVNAYAVGANWVHVAVGGGGTREGTPSASGSGTGGSSNQSTPAKPLEERGGPVTNPTPSPIPTIESKTSSYVSAIEQTTVAGKGLTVWTWDKLMAFLVGETLFLEPQVLAAITSRSNSLTFFTSGEIRGLLDVLARFNAKPLNQRRDRFSTANRSRRGEGASTPHCAGGH